MFLGARSCIARYGNPPNGTIVIFSHSQVELGQRQVAGPFRACTALSAALVAVILVPKGVAQSPTWSAPGVRGAQSATSDLQLLLRIRKSLLQDDELARHMIGVSVREHVAALWGSVPSPELSQRAEQRTRQVLGVAAVRNELRIASPSENDRPVVVRRPAQSRDMLSNPIAMGPASVRKSPRELGTIADKARVDVTLHWQPARTEPASSTFVREATDQRELATGPLTRDTKTANVELPAKPALAETSSSRTRQPDEKVVTLPAIQISREERYALERPLAILSSSSRLHENDPLTRSIEALQKSDVSFLAVSYRISNGDVYLTAKTEHATAQFALAQKVSQLPGVKKVILEDAPSKSP
jgi:osmotically-inducible protein OsmY